MAEPATTPQGKQSPELRPNSQLGERVRFSIVVPCHNAPRDVLACLNSVSRTISASLDEMIIVDDASAPETQRIIEESLGIFPSGNVHRFDERVGFPKAANFGAGKAKGKYIILLNSDTIVYRGWLDEFEALFQTNSRVGVIGPLSNNAGFAQSFQFRNLTRALRRTLPIPHAPTTKCRSRRSRTVIECKDLNGFCLAIRSKVLTQVGLFDPHAYGIGYGEELDFFARLAKTRWRAGIATSVYVHHSKQKSFTNDEVSAQKKANLKQVKEKYGRRHFLKIWVSRLAAKLQVRINLEFGNKRVHRRTESGLS